MTYSGFSNSRLQASALITPCFTGCLVLLLRPSAMNNPIRFKLFLMMVLEFFIWGCWLPKIFAYLPSLHFNATWQQPLILNAFPIAAIIGMFFSNQYADRHFAAEKFLAFSHLVAGLAILGLGFTKLFWPFFFLMLLHCLFYVPTISITNSIPFAQMRNAQK